jgi:hypothetical protein
MSDLERAFKALDGKLERYNALFQYADGNQPLIYSTNRLREAFDSLNARFTQNWCSVVVAAALDRILLKGFDLDQGALRETLEGIWNDNQLGLEAEQVHEAALITHEAFIIAWPDEAGKVQAFYNDPRLCHVFYSADNPRRKEFACKWYVDEGSRRWHLTLYYPDRLEYYVTKSRTSRPTSYTAFEPNPERPTARNDYGIIPVFHFRTSSRSQNGELDNILTLQDAVNKLLADMMVAAEFGAFRQRYIISNADPGSLKTLKNAPNEIWSIPAGDGVGQQTQVGEFPGADLDRYLNAIDKLANSIAIISRTPKHYFYNAGASLSGEALIAMEAPLNKKVARLQESFGIIWQELAAFLLRLSGKGEVDQTSIKPVWAPAQSIQPYTEALTRKTAVDAGVPLITQLRREGWSNADLKQMESDQQEARAKSTSLAAAVLQQVRTQQEQQNPPGQPIPPGQAVSRVNNGQA